MGIDPSMRSTGICVWDVEANVHKYYLICSTATKKAAGFKHDRFNMYMYDAIPVKDKTSIEKEHAKTSNIYSILTILEGLIDYYQPDVVNVEAIAMSANGRVDELSGLNYGIRLMCMNMNIPCNAIPPTSNKMEFSGNGQATKEMMVLGWQACESDGSIYIHSLGKHVEDIADAYALAHYPIR